MRGHAAERMDYVLFSGVIALIGFGFLMIYSSSSVLAYQNYGDSAYFFKRQVLWAVFSAGTGMFLYYKGIALLPKLVWPLMIAAIVLLVAVHIPGLGRRVGGATRWIHLGPLSFQPFELAKLAYVLFLAQIMSNEDYTLSRKIIRSGMVTGVVVLGLIWQKDLGGTAIIIFLYLAMLLITGVPLWILLLLIPAGGLVVYLLIKAEPYRLKRIMTFLNPWNDYYGAGWQTIQSQIAVGSGGIFGVGFANSQQKFLYLPTPHTDYIFSIIGEEWGLLGAAAVLGMFFLLLVRGLFIAINVQDKFLKYTAAGLTLMITTQAFINIAVAEGLMPAKGTTLPFISFGGSSLIIGCAAIGLLLAISRHAYGGSR